MHRSAAPLPNLSGRPTYIIEISGMPSLCSVGVLVEGERQRPRCRSSPLLPTVHGHVDDPSQAMSDEVGKNESSLVLAGRIRWASVDGARSTAPRQRT
jgi:hypothetical protein